MRLIFAQSLSGEEVKKSFNGEITYSRILIGILLSIVNLKNIFVKCICKISCRSINLAYAANTIMKLLIDKICSIHNSDAYFNHIVSYSCN